MVKDIGFGVLGLGMGANRCRVIHETEGACLVAVADIRTDRAQQIGEQYGVDWYGDYKQLLDRDDIDVVYVMTFSGLHGDHAIMAARAGKHVITTKPMEVSLQRADQMIRECENAGVKLAVDFDMRYDQTQRTIKKAIHEGRLGTLILGEARLKWFRSQAYYDENYGWRGTWKLDGGGSLSNQTVHFIDQLLWMMGPVQSVYAEVGVYTHDIEGEDLGTVLLTFESGARGVIVGTTTFPRNCYAGIEIHGDKGAVLTTRGSAEWIGAEGVDLTPPVPDPCPKNATEDMTSAITKGTQVQVDGYEGRKSVEVLEAIRRSVETGQRVNLPL